MNRRIASIALLALGCSSTSELPFDVEGPPDDQVVATPEKTCSEKQKTYTGFGGKSLTATRVEKPAGEERARLKGYDVLVDDYQRLVGFKPSVLAESGPTFGAPAARWYAEGKPDAVALYQAYRVGFEACLTVTAKDAKYALAPVAETAAAECAALERKYWSRTPNPDEIWSCATSKLSRNWSMAT